MSAHVGELDRFFSTQPKAMYIGGEWLQAESGQTFDTLDPGKATRLAAVAAETQRMLIARFWRRSARLKIAAGPPCQPMIAQFICIVWATSLKRTLRF